MPEQPRAPTPERIFEILGAYQRTEALKAAIELDLFTAIGEGATTVKALAPRLDASERGIRILCDYLVVVGLLTKAKDAYGLPPDSSLFLDRRSLAYIGTATRFLMAPELTRGMRQLAGAVRKGGTSLEGEGTVTANNPLWVEFARGMAPLVRPAAEFIADVVVPDAGTAAGELKVLDVAAGHGLFGIHLARRNPKAEVFALDWPAVLEVAGENAIRAGVAERHHRVPGSAFELDFGEAYDVVLLTNFFHHFDIPTCTDIMRKAHRALREGGRAVTLEFVPNEDRVSPPQPAAFSLVMLSTTPSGDAYTFSQYEEMFRAAGFSRSELHPVPGLFQSVIVSFK